MLEVCFLLLPTCQMFDQLYGPWVLGMPLGNSLLMVNGVSEVVPVQVELRKVSKQEQT